MTAVGAAPRPTDGRDRRIGWLPAAAAAPLTALAWALPAGAFTSHRVDAVEAAYPLLVVGTWVVLGWFSTPSTARKVRVGLIVSGILGAAAGTAASAPSPTVAARASQAGTFVAEVEETGSGADTRIVVSRPGRLLSAQLQPLCTTDTSGVLNDAAVTWTGPDVFALTLGDDARPYVSFRITGDRVEPDADLDWRTC